MEPDAHVHGSDHTLVIKMSGAGDNRSIEIAGSPAPSHQVQIARDHRFTNMASDRVIAGNKFALGDLPVNAYYIRVRAIAGSEQPTGAWSEPRLLEIYPLGGGWWLSEPPTPISATAPANR